MTDARSAFLDEPGHLVRIATVDDDGWPRVVPTWFVRDGDDVVFTPRSPAVFLANLRRDPRLALSVDEDALPYRKVTVQGDGPHPATSRATTTCGATPTEPSPRATSRSSRPRPTSRTPSTSRGRSSACRSPASRVTTWRMPVEDEAPTGIWARRYYADGTAFANLADELRG